MYMYIYIHTHTHAHTHTHTHTHTARGVHDAARWKPQDLCRHPPSCVSGGRAGWDAVVHDEPRLLPQDEHAAARDAARDHESHYVVAGDARTMTAKHAMPASIVGE